MKDRRGQWFIRTTIQWMYYWLCHFLHHFRRVCTIFLIRALILEKSTHFIQLPLKRGSIHSWRLFAFCGQLSFKYLKAFSLCSTMLIMFHRAKNDKINRLPRPFQHYCISVEYLHHMENMPLSLLIAYHSQSVSFYAIWELDCKLGAHRL